MATEPRYTFDFAELRPRPAALRVVAPDLRALPGGARQVAPSTRPSGAEPLPAFFTAGEPLHVQVAGPDERFCELLRRALAGYFAAAGAETGLVVWMWGRGFAVGPPGLTSIPRRPHAALVACELVMGAALPAAQLVRTAPGPAWLVLSRNQPSLDATLGVSAPPFADLSPDRLWRLAELTPLEVAENAHGRLAALGSGAFSRRCRDLAGALARSYRDAQP